MAGLAPTTATDSQITERMRIGANGIVAIGTTDTSTVVGGNPTSLYLNANSPATLNRIQFRLDNTTQYTIGAGTNFGISAGEGTSRIFLKGGTGTDAGFVGIGLTAVADKLHVAGEARVNACVKKSDGASIAGTCPSDQVLKKDIQRLNPVLENLAALQPSSFLWRADEFPDRFFGSERSYGLIAQEVEQALPELVATDDHGMKAVHYEMLPLYTLQGMRELKAENDVLREQNATLEARLAAIEQRLNGGMVPLVAAR